MFTSPFRFVSSFSFVIINDGILSENGILLLTQSNFKKALREHELLLVKFYLSWCPHCKGFENEYLKVKRSLDDQKSNVTLGQVDAHIDQALAKEYRVIGYPAIRLFRNGKVLNYYGLKQAEHIVEWLNKKFKA